MRRVRRGSGDNASPCCHLPNKDEIREDKVVHEEERLEEREPRRRTAHHHDSQRDSASVRSNSFLSFFLSFFLSCFLSFFLAFFLFNAH